MGEYYDPRVPFLASNIPKSKLIEPTGPIRKRKITPVLAKSQGERQLSKKHLLFREMRENKVKKEMLERLNKRIEANKPIVRKALSANIDGHEDLDQLIAEFITELPSYREQQEVRGQYSRDFIPHGNLHPTGRKMRQEQKVEFNKLPPLPEPTPHPVGEGVRKKRARKQK